MCICACVCVRALTACILGDEKDPEEKLCVFGILGFGSPKVCDRPCSGLLIVSQFVCALLAKLQTEKPRDSFRCRDQSGCDCVKNKMYT